jgi:hypothetical protein
MSHNRTGDNYLVAEWDSDWHDVMRLLRGGVAPIDMISENLSTCAGLLHDYQFGGQNGVYRS